jgi:uncharacterized cupredoxin-like copper-binding protein
MALAVTGALAAVFTSTIGAASSATPVKISVTAKDYSFTLTKKIVPRGTTVLFTVVNRGKTVHDFQVNGKKSAFLPPGKKATFTVRFAKKATLQYVCTIPRHAELGMVGLFKVS